MVDFNPQVPQAPDNPYIYYSRPITKPEVDTSKEIALKGLAQGVEGGIGIAEGYTKQSILTQEHQGLDTINDAAIDRLNAAKANPSLLAMEDNQATPEAVKGLPKTLDTLDQARANNKISQTYIDMQKDALAKQLRSQYPGHRDFIDETFSKSSREDPANRYITSLIGDINSLASAAGEKRNATQSLAIDGLKKFPSNSNWNNIANSYFNGQMDDATLRSAYFKFSSQDADRKRQDEDFHRDELDRKSQGQRAEDIMNERASQSVNNFFYSHTISTPGLATPSALAELARKAAAGEVQLTPDQKSSILNQLVAAKTAFMTDMETEFNSTADPSRPSYATLAGSTKSKEIIADKAKMFDTVIDQMSNERYGLMASTVATVKGIEAETQLGLFNNPDKELASFVRTMSVLGKTMPPQALDRLISAGLARDIDTRFRDYVKRSNIEALAPPPQVPDKDNSHSIKADVERVQDLGDKAPKGNSGAKVYQGLLDGVNSIIDKGIPDDNKRNAVEKFFAPANRGLISKFGDPTKVFTDMTSDKMSQEIHKLGGRSWEIYQGWVKDSFGTELFPQALRDINKAEQAPITGVSVSWDTEKHQFGVHGASPGPHGTTFHSPEQVQVEQSVDKINSGLRSVSGMAKYSGEDVNAYLAKLMLDSGYQGNLFKAFTAAHQKPEAQE